MFRFPLSSPPLLHKANALNGGKLASNTGLQDHKGCINRNQAVANRLYVAGVWDAFEDADAVEDADKHAKNVDADEGPRAKVGEAVAEVKIVEEAVAVRLADDDEAVAEENSDAETDGVEVGFEIEIEFALDAATDAVDDEVADPVDFEVTDTCKVEVTDEDGRQAGQVGPLEAASYNPIEPRGLS